MIIKNKWLILSILAISSTTNLAIAEETESGPYIVAPSVGYYIFDRDKNLNAKDGVSYGLGAGYQVNKNFAIEGSYSRLNSEVKDDICDYPHYIQSGEGLDADIYNVDAIFSLNLNSNWAPYLVAGYTHLEPDPNFGNDDNIDMMNAGVGVKRKITPALSVRADARAFHNFDNEDTDYAVNAALVYRFGAEKSVTPPPPPPPCPTCVNPCLGDDDGDGVDNCKDACPDTPANAEVKPTGCPFIKEPKEIELKVLFDYDQAIVKQQYFDEIQEVADFMNQYPNTGTEIQGHTDSRGSDAYNQDLSQRRADAVREVLVNHFNIHPSRLTSVGYGESRLLVSPEVTDLDYQTNRRVIARIETMVSRSKQ